MKNKYFLFFVLILLNCKEISIPDIYNEYSIDLDSSEYQRFKEEVCIDLSGNNIKTNAFIKAYSISRLFYSYLKNNTGSLEDIIKQALFKKFYYDKTKINFSKDLCSHQMKIVIKNYEFIWFPPQEFIQNPIPVRKGQFLGSLQAEYIIKYDKSNISKIFNRNIKLNLLPGEEYNAIENTIAQILKEFIEEVYIEYWKLKLKNP
jgi:hypothetical protein